jgi:hypothetical protein
MLELNFCRWMHFDRSSSEEDKPESAKNGDSQNDTDDQNQQDARSGLRLPRFGRGLDDTTLIFFRHRGFPEPSGNMTQLPRNASVPGAPEPTGEGNVGLQ